MTRAGATLFAAITFACSPSSDSAKGDAGGTSDATAESSDATENGGDGAVFDSSADGDGKEARDGATCPPNVPCGCVCPIGDASGDCVCENFSEPYCPVPLDELGTCHFDGGCMGCSEGAGFMCACSDAGIGVPGGWFCVGTEYTCTGGTPL